MEKRVIVVGGGIAGLTASLTAAELGEKVLLLEKSPSIGGMLERLDTWFVDDACGMCQILSQFSTDEKLDRCLRRDFYHPLIDVRTLTLVKSVEETDEGLVLTLQKLPRYVDEVKCTGCRLCEEVCPEESSDPFDKGFSKHKAIHTLYTGSLTKIYYIDKEICNECGKCVEVCPTKAIDLNQKESEEKIIASSIILTTGFSEIDPSTLTSFGYGKFKNVLTSLDFERLISRTGIHPDELKRPSDSKVPSKVAIIQCVGSRDKDRGYCSSACCMYALKEARKIKEIEKDTEVSIFYMDIRAYGKGHYRYYLSAEKMGIKFENYRIPSVSEDINGNLLIKYEEDEKLITETYDLVILSTGQEINEDTKKLLNIIGVNKDEYGFVIGKEFETFKTSKENVYVAGSLANPKDIENSVIEARAAGFLATGEGFEVNEREKPSLDIDYRIVKFGIFICQCGGVIKKDLDTTKIKKILENFSDITHIEEIDLVCQENRLDSIMKRVIEKGITRIIFATCSPAKYEVLIRNAVEHYGFKQSMVEILSLREHIAWSYENNGEDVAVQRIHSLMEKLRLAVGNENIYKKGVTKAVVIGGGLAGMISALNLSKRGIAINIIENDKTLGGNAERFSYTLEGEDVQNYIAGIKKEVEQDDRISVHLESQVVSLDGAAGSFIIAIQKDTEKENICAGTVIVATGAQEYQPTEYSYGKNEKIITQLEFEKYLLNPSSDVSSLTSVVMIQCVGSRNDEHPWCSKVCCSDAIKNSLLLKEKNKEINITILYRDMMSYGKKELKFSEAREKGINFIKYLKEDEPRVSVDDAKIKVNVKDLVLDRELMFEPDMLVLSTGIVPYDNKKLSKILGVSLDEDGFFKGANPKFRPHESEKSGIFFAGLCRSPSSMQDAVTEATAAAASAYLFLRESPLVQRRTISEVIERWCGGCEFCIDACPFDARFLDVEKKIVKVREINCV
ncbi:CoB--CoM heterodisulfide reductase iron-sulfur subunit A family protein, partial [candidate division WOR-3 bacterium]|nr:CoB--CoM heterodisulfide reductase iron-sulfur subunit A family protein [candidate division WOR-3 bacterium]